MTDVPPIVDDNLSIIGATLREMREEEGLQQWALAQKAGCRQALISNMELGKNDFKYSSLVKVTDAMGYDIIIHFHAREGADPEWEKAFNEALMGAVHA